MPEPLAPGRVILGENAVQGDPDSICQHSDRNGQGHNQKSYQKFPMHQTG